MTLRILGGKFKGRALETPETDTTRPITSILRKSLFDSCQFFIEDAIVLDLFAGSGSIGLEALSRGAKRAYFVDNNRVAIRSIETNVEKFGVEEETVVLQQDAFSLFPNPHFPPFDIIFMHPPYPIGEAGYERLIHYIEAHVDQFTNGAHLYLETPAELTSFGEALLLRNFSVLKTKTSSTTGLIHFTYTKTD